MIHKHQTVDRSSRRAENDEGVNKNNKKKVDMVSVAQVSRYLGGIYLSSPKMMFPLLYS